MKKLRIPLSEQIAPEDQETLLEMQQVKARTLHHKYAVVTIYDYLCRLFLPVRFHELEKFQNGKLQGLERSVDWLGCGWFIRQRQRFLILSGTTIGRSAN
jgi:hypothetical protein